ncbi:MAG: 8-amino-7-oxononanoate synthase [Puia sp.]|nr:8-amino-7-oxononanoate synthase [Puia sp.]
MSEEFLRKKLQERWDQDAYRTLKLPTGKADFCSNDYLGIAAGGLLEACAGKSSPATGNGLLRHGSSGSRLLAGNYALMEETEKEIALFHQAPAGLIFNSGFDANLGLLSAVPQRNDTILYDSLSHASIRDGIRLSFARSFPFVHNDTADLEKRLRAATGTVFVVTESVFSMDGDQAPLREIAALCKQYGARLIVDEAHATGVIGDRGEGLVQQMALQESVFARIHTFGKALGCHGAVILGSELLRDYLINFSRPFIYTTALPETSVQAIVCAYRLFPALGSHRERLRQLIARFREEMRGLERPAGPARPAGPDSVTPIQVALIPGNEAVKRAARLCQENGLDVRPILYPTVPKGGERLRIVLHSFNTPEELSRLVAVLQ